MTNTPVVEMSKHDVIKSADRENEAVFHHGAHAASTFTAIGKRGAREITLADVRESTPLFDS